MFEKIIIALILVLAAVLVFSGCTDAEKIEDAVESKADLLEDTIESRFDPVEDEIESRLDAAEDALLGNPTAIPTTVDAASEPATVGEADIETTADPVQNSLDKIIDIVGDAVKQQASSADSSTAVAQDQFITAEAAKQIALDHAGIAAADAVFDRTERDFDNGVWYYEVEFHVGLTEFEYDIHAENGTVLSFEKDR